MLTRMGSVGGMGKDRLAWQQMAEIADYAREIEKKRQSLIAEAGEDALQMARAISYAMFGLFNMCT